MTKAYDIIFKSIRDDKFKPLKEIVEKFSEGHQLDLDVRDKAGKTLLMLAAQHCLYGSFDIIKTLLQAGANPKITTISGKSPLTTAIAYGNLVDTLMLIYFVRLRSNVLSLRISMWIMRIMEEVPR